MIATVQAASAKVAIRRGVVQLESCAPMVSAVCSAVSEAFSDSKKETAAFKAVAAGRIRYFFKVPDLRDETASAISKANAWPTFIGICRAIHDRGRRGTKAEQDAADNGVIGVGIKALAKAAGVNAVTVRRQIRRLHGLGLVVVHTRGIIEAADPTTGKIKANRIGRTPTALVYLTVTEAHMRPAAAKAAAKVGGAKRTPSGRADRVQSAPPSIERTIEKKETPPTVPQEAGLTAGKAGGHSAAEASQEGRQVGSGVQRQDDPKPEATSSPPAEAGPPGPNREIPVPVGNVVPPERSGLPWSAASTRSSQSFWAGLIAKGVAANESVADGSGMRGGSFLDEYRRACGLPVIETANDTIEADQAGDELRKALDDLPADSRRRARDLGRDIEGDEAKALNVLIEERQRRAIEERRVEAAARKEAAREAYRRQKAAEAAA